MIHFLTPLPLPYQQTLFRVLNDHYGSDLLVWFSKTHHIDFPFKVNSVDGFRSRYLDRERYWDLFSAIFADKDAVVILGGWRSPMTIRALLITTVLRVPVFIWADHPHPRRRNLAVRALRTLYLKLLNRAVAGFLGCGQPTVEHLISLGLSREKVALFPYWTDLPSHWTLPKGSSEEAASDRHPLRLVTVGRLAPVKQFRVAIEAVSLANRRAGYTLAELVIAGDGPDRLSLETLAEERSCANCVTFLGWREGHEISREIETADLLLITSIFEPYGVVVLEAMSAGRGVLASEGVIAAVDRNEGTGAVLFHEIGDTEELAGQIAWFAADRQRLHHASIAARRTAEKWPPRRAINMLAQILIRTAAGRRLVSRANSPSETELRPDKPVGVHR